MRKRKVILFIAVIPQDYTSAEVEVCYTREEASEFIKDHAIRGDIHYCSILEKEVEL